MKDCMVSMNKTTEGSLPPFLENKSKVQRYRGQTLDPDE